MFEDAIKKAANDNTVDPNVIKAIISQESQWNMFAIRNEPNYRWLYKVEEFAKHPLISLSTELATQKMSWGLGQIMGGLAREQGHKGLMGELLDPNVNIKHIGLRVKTLSDITKTPEEIFACYNGGPDALHKVNGVFRNLQYVQACMAFLTKYQQS